MATVYGPRVGDDYAPLLLRRSDNEVVTPDEFGLVFDDLEGVKEEAARALAELANDVIPGTVRRVLASEVSDAEKRPLLEARLVFEIVPITSAHQPVPA